jgi:hypothetical protein
MNDQVDLDDLFVQHLTSTRVTVRHGSLDTVVASGRRRAVRRHGVMAGTLASVVAVIAAVVVPRFDDHGGRLIIGAQTTTTDAAATPALTTAGRELAVRVSDELYTMAGRSPVLPSMTLLGRVDSGNDVGWARFDTSTGTFQNCGVSVGGADDRDAACFRYSIQPDGDLVTVEVTTRSACNADLTNCVFERFQQRWNRRSFLDYAMFTDQETLSPSLYPAQGETGFVVASNGETHYVDQAWALDHCADRKTQDATSPYTLGTPDSMWGGTFLPGLVAGPDGDTRRRQAVPGDTSAPTGLWSPWSRPIDGTWVGGVQDAGLRHADCFDIAYAGKGIVDGPIKTNDRYLWYCGSPVFTGEVSTNRDPARPAPSVSSDYFRKAEASGCSADAPGTPTGSRPSSDPTVSSRPFEQIPQDLGDYPKYASVTLTAASSGYATVTLTGTGNGAAVTDDSGSRNLTLAPRSLVFVNGDLRLSSAVGAESSGITFMATGSIAIADELLGPQGRASDLGVIAKKSVMITQSSKNLRIDASIMAIDETVYVTGWNQPRAEGARFTVDINGTVAARYRPVFGTFSGVGELVSGMEKNIVYPKDRRPNPPYFPSPLNAAWERDELTEIPFVKTEIPSVRSA